MGLREELVFRPLLLSDEAAFRTALATFADRDFEFAPGFDATQPFSTFLTSLADRQDKTKVAADRVPISYRWAFRRNETVDEIVGRFSVRHGLTGYGTEAGGHIGVGIAPKFRGHGYAKHLLQAALAFAGELGLRKALIVCAEDNDPARGAVESCGGTFERLCTAPADGVRRVRYWIDVRAQYQVNALATLA